MVCYRLCVVEFIYLFLTIFSSKSRSDPVVKRASKSQFPFLITSNGESCAARSGWEQGSPRGSLSVDCKPHQLPWDMGKPLGCETKWKSAWDIALVLSSPWALLTELWAGTATLQLSPVHWVVTWDVCIKSILLCFWMNLRIFDLGIRKKNESLSWSRSESFSPLLPCW